MNMMNTSKFIGTGSEWTFDLLEKFDSAIKQHAEGYGLETYPNQIEVITAEQMLDAYSTTGLPVRYAHWSFGKDFILQEQRYRRGFQGLAYEIVINSSPCIAYLMEENTLPMQVLVIAHACYGHNGFFKNNYLFQQWTQANAIIDYLVFANTFISDCEDRYGIEAVEETLDSCHALSDHGVYKYKRPNPISARREQERLRERMAFAEKHYNELWRTLPTQVDAAAEIVGDNFPSEPEENLLYFVEKYSPTLKPWQREIVRIVRKLAQYFYPQRQTKVMNEGYATFWHYTLLNTLYDHRQINDAFMLEFLHSHSSVVYQPPFDSKHYSGINPYALGFAMFSDIRRICEKPTAEDRQWFPQLAGSDWTKAIDFAMRNYRDESFILQYLSPKLMRDFRLFAIADHEKDDHLLVSAIHDDSGYKELRRLLAAQYRLENVIPDIQVVHYKRDKDRSLVLHHKVHQGRTLEGTTGNAVMKHMARLWGFPVLLEEVGASGEAITYLRAEP
jgi:stage V sporulation protein R